MATPYGVNGDLVLSRVELVIDSEQDFVQILAQLMEVQTASNKVLETQLRYKLVAQHLVQVFLLVNPKILRNSERPLFMTNRRQTNLVLVV